MISRRGFGLALAGTVQAEASHLIDVSGRSLGTGDAYAQTRHALRALRLRPRSILHTTVYLTDPKYLAEVDRAYRVFFGREFPARTVLVAGLLTPGALVEISATASRHPRRLIGDAFPASAASEAGGTLFLSALRAEGAGVEQQTDRLMQLQNDVLAKAGYSFADLVLSKIYLSEPAAYNALNGAYQRYVTAPPPARATIHAKPVRPGELLQVQSIAVRGSGAGRPSGKGITSPIHSYSVLAGPRLYITGMTGRMANGGFTPDLASQTRQALAMISEQLERHGLGFPNVVETTVWLRDIGDFGSLMKGLPVSGARTIVGIPPSSPEALVEIQMVAEMSARQRHARSGK